MTGLAYFGQLGIRGTDETQLLTILALVAIAGFVVWLLFFSGNGDFKSFLEDLKGQPKNVKKELFPVPVFDRSKIEVPLPPKPERKPLTYKRTADEIDLKLDTWAKDLRQSLREVRAESQWLVEKYKDVPLKRPKPESPTKKKAATSKKKAKPAIKSMATSSRKTTAKLKPSKSRGKTSTSRGKKPS